MGLIFEDLSIIILILGLIGNSLGFYCAMKDKILFIRVYLTRIFHAVNLVNYIFMILYPILDKFSEFHSIPFRNRLPWNLYKIYYHAILAKTLVNFSFGIYVIFAVSQMIAIVYPFYYKQYFTFRRIRIMIAICFFYCLAWYVPSIWWFKLLKFENVCGDDRGSVVYSLTYSTYNSKEERYGWISLAILMETFTRFLPVVIILILNYFSLKRKRSKLNWRSENALSNLQNATIVSNNRSVVPESGENRPSVINFPGYEDKSKIECSTTSISAIGIGKISKTGSKTGSKKDSKIYLQSQQKVKQIELEYRMSVRMLAILMLQFVVFLFPVSIYLITLEFLDLRTSGESDMILAVCTLLEYSYISFSFYLNMMFNPGYRKNAYNIFMKSELCKYFNKRLKKNNLIYSEITN
ncbi:unnamed protein product [Gordionus sp. m RMFG-2023]